jgi:starch phosphorylase
MRPVKTFIALPNLPPQLRRLRDLSMNLRWAWHHDTIELFRRLDDALWEQTNHNPVRMLGMIDQRKLNALAEDEGFIAHLERVATDLDAYQAAKGTWFQKKAAPGGRLLVAYFSAEFGITECLSIFAGGLGILAGDHLKSSSDLGVPLVGVGLLYQEGYFKQYLNEAGWQQEVYEDNDFHTLPLTLQRKKDGSPLKITVSLPGRDVAAQIWLAQVGRVQLYLLDTNIDDNPPPDRDISDQLYGGDNEMRIKQEILLGIGGYRALRALGLNPDVYHMNEGHSAFLSLEHMNQLMSDHGLTLAEAREAAAASLMFTTHTPVPAGHDYFPPDLMDRYFSSYFSAMGFTRKNFLALGRQRPDDDSERFCMTILALRLSAHSNAVSRLHGEVTRNMWKNLWPGVTTPEIPIDHVTNGVHFQSWISREMKELYDRYLGPRWREEVADQSVWQLADNIASTELWRTHERRRERLVSFARRRLREQLKQRGATETAVEMAYDVLEPETLTIGFARRFATYKRATLLFRDPDRLARILNNPDRPVQLIFAGKAHPRDDAGKTLIKQIVDLARQERFRRHIVFLENYDNAVARSLLQGADVWLNTPIRLQEASGTSGMKASANGVLNLSILDGWWDEAYAPDVGWAIGRRETYADQNYQDQVEAEALYGLLEQEIVPMFYDRHVDGLPRKWIDRMKISIRQLCRYFTTHRMVGEYTERYYLPVAAHHQRMAEGAMAPAKILSAWKTRVSMAWPKIRINAVSADHIAEILVGTPFNVQAEVSLGELTPEDVTVQLFLGNVDGNGEIKEGQTSVMVMEKSTQHGMFLYNASVVISSGSGLYGYTVRVLPHHPELVTPFQPGLITWAITSSS